MPSLGDATRRPRRDMAEASIAVVQALCDTDEPRATGIGPVPRQVAVMPVGGLREPTATAAEDGGRIAGSTGIAARSSVAVPGLYL